MQRASRDSDADVIQQGSGRASVRERKGEKTSLSRHCRVRPAVLALFASFPAINLPASAQVQAGVLSGSVRDSAGRVLAGAVVVLDYGSDRSRSTAADTRGRFRFDRVAPGSHSLRTTWIGYVPDDRTIDFPQAGLDIEVTLSPLPFKLDTLRLVARRTGVFGTVVARSDFRALASAGVTVLATRFRTRTAADGRFSFGDLPEGAYVLRAQRTGFATRLLSFAVPEGEAVEVAAAMDSIADRATALRERLYFDLETRINRRSTPNSAIVAVQELAPRRSMSLDLALRYSPSFLRRGLMIEGEECVIVNGQFAFGMRLKDFVASDVEMVEVYATGGGGADLSAAAAASARTSGCGYWSVKESFDMGDGGRGSVGGRLVVTRRPRPGLVTRAYVWLKP